MSGRIWHTERGHESMWTNDGPALYLNADKSKVVAADSIEAAFLLVAAGGQLPESEAARWGLSEKAKTPPPNKAKTPPPNKGK